MGLIFYMNKTAVEKCRPKSGLVVCVRWKRDSYIAENVKFSHENVIIL